MSQFTEKIEIEVSREKVWDILSDLGNIHVFNPGVSNSYYTSEQKEDVGAARVCELLPMGKVEETATVWNEGTGFTLKIDPIEKMPPMKNIFAYADLKEINANKVSVSIGIQYEMKLGIIGSVLNQVVVKNQMRKGIASMLQGLKLYAETGVEIKDAKALHALLAA